jgi:hypothetical protein
MDCPPYTLKLNRAAELPIFANPLPMEQLSLVKSSGGLDLPYQEGACLSTALPTEMQQKQNLFQG